MTGCLSLEEATQRSLTRVTQKSPSTSRVLKREGNGKDPFRTRVLHNFNAAFLINDNGNHLISTLLYLQLNTILY